MLAIVATKIVVDIHYLHAVGCPVDNFCRSVFMAILEDVFSTVDDVWSNSRVIHKRLDLWAPTTIQHALNTLAKAGLIEKREVPNHPWPSAEYRRKQPELQTAKPAGKNAYTKPLTEQQLFSAMKELSRRKPCPEHLPAVAAPAAASAPNTHKTA